MALNKEIRIATIRKKKLDISTGGDKVDFEYLEFLNSINNVQVDYVDWEDIGLKSISRSAKTKIDKLLIAISDMTNYKKPFLKLCQYDYIFINIVRGMRVIPLLTHLKNNGVKTVCILHHYPWMEYKGIKRRVIKLVLDRLIDVSSYVILAGFPVYDFTIKRNLISESKIRYWGIGIDKKIHYDATPVPGRVLCISNIMRHKGIHRLVYSIKRIMAIKDIRVDILGRIVEQDYYEEICKYCIDNNLTSTITILGYVSDEKKEEYLDNADVFAFPSYQEGYGIAMIEAMQHGLPVIAFDNSALPYTVKDYVNGRIIEEDDMDSFAEAIREIIQDRALRGKLSKGAYKTAENCEEKKEVNERIISFVEELQRE